MMALRSIATRAPTCGAIGLLLGGCFLVQQTSDAVPRIPRFSIPVSRTATRRRFTRVAAAVSGRAESRLPPSPRMQLAALPGCRAVMCC